MTGKERDLDAAERALGTLPRKGESARARREREAWERRLAALLGPVEPVAPPPGTFARISERLAHAETRETLKRTRGSARRWKGIASVAGLLAAGFAFFAFAPRPVPEKAARYVAIVTADEGGAPGMIVQFDTGTGIATVTPVLPEAPGGNVYQMWHVPAGTSKPVSLGLVPDGPAIRTNFEAGPGDLFGISIEPPGGSPTGLPTDARWHGEIVRVE